MWEAGCWRRGVGGKVEEGGRGVKVSEYEKPVLYTCNQHTSPKEHKGSLNSHPTIAAACAPQPSAQSAWAPTARTHPLVQPLPTSRSPSFWSPPAGALPLVMSFSTPQQLLMRASCALSSCALQAAAKAAMTSTGLFSACACTSCFTACRIQHTPWSRA